MALKLKKKTVSLNLTQNPVLTPILGVLDFLNEVKVELSKVVWPTKAQTIQLTVMVIVIALIVGFFLGGVDYLLTILTEWLLKLSN